MRDSTGQSIGNETLSTSDAEVDDETTEDLTHKVNPHEPNWRMTPPADDTDEPSRGTGYSLLGVLRDFFAVFLGHSGSAFLGFLTAVILARFLTKEDFGTYSAFVAFVLIFAYLVDLGITQSFIRFGSVLHANQDVRALHRMGAAAVRGKIILGLCIGAVGGIVLGATPLGEELGNPWLYVLVPIGGVTISFFYFLTGSLQVGRLFRKVSLLMLVKASVLIVLAALALVAGLRESIIYCLIFVIAGIASVLAFSGQMRSVAPRQALKESRTRKEIGALLQFGKWIAVSSMSFAVFEQIPVTAALAFFGASDVALFSVGLALVASLQLLNAPLLTILAPDLSRISSRIDLRNYLTTMYRILIPASALILILGVYLSSPVVTLIFGDEYADSAPLFSILLIPFVLVFATLPLTAAMVYVFDRPRTPALVNTAQLVLLLGLIMVFGGDMDLPALVGTYAAIRGGGTVVVAALALIHLNRWR